MRSLGAALLLALLAVGSVIADPTAKPDAPARDDSRARWDDLYRPGTWWISEIDGNNWGKVNVVMLKGDLAVVRIWAKSHADSEFEGEGKRDKVKYQPLDLDGYLKAQPSWRETKRGDDTLCGLACTWIEGEVAGVATKVWVSTRFGPYLVMRQDVAGKTKHKVTEFHEPATPDSRAQWDALAKPGTWWLFENKSPDFIGRGEVLTVEGDVARTRVWHKRDMVAEFNTRGGVIVDPYKPSDILAKPDPSCDKPETGVETVKIGEVEFECDWVKWDVRGHISKAWYSKRFGRYLPIRIEVDGKLSMHMLEFHEAGSTPIKDAGPDPREQWRAVYKPGNLWIVIEDVWTHIRTGVISMKDDVATVKRWKRIDSDGEFKGEGEQLTVKYSEPTDFDSNDRLRVRSLGKEKINVNDGKWECDGVDVGELEGPLQTWTVPSLGDYLPVRVDRLSEGGTRSTLRRLIEFHGNDLMLVGEDKTVRDAQFEALFKPGAYWIAKVTIGDDTTWQKTEVVSVKDRKVAMRQWTKVKETDTFKGEGEKLERDYAAMTPFFADFDWAEKLPVTEKIANLDFTCYRVGMSGDRMKVWLCDRFGTFLQGKWEEMTFDKKSAEYRPILTLIEFHEGK